MTCRSEQNLSSILDYCKSPAGDNLSFALYWLHDPDDRPTAYGSSQQDLHLSARAQLARNSEQPIRFRLYTQRCSQVCQGNGCASSQVSLKQQPHWKSNCGPRTRNDLALIKTVKTKSLGRRKSRRRPVGVMILSEQTTNEGVPPIQPDLIPARSQTLTNESDGIESSRCGKVREWQGRSKRVLLGQENEESSGICC